MEGGVEAAVDTAISEAADISATEEGGEGNFIVVLLLKVLLSNS